MLRSVLVSRCNCHHHKTPSDLAVRTGSLLYTDSTSSYRALKGYVHELVNHTQKEYARGEVHKNRAEYLFSL